MSNIIAVDFDGTIAKHNWPSIGEEVPGAISALRSMHAKGWEICLWTCRTGVKLAEAIQWIEERINFPLDGINISPSSHGWIGGVGPKMFANFYIDDAAVGCPLVKPGRGERPYVNWALVRRQMGF